MSEIKDYSRGLTVDFRIDILFAKCELESRFNK
jgi:hypothetical protein